MQTIFNHGLLYKRCAKSMGKPKIRPSTAPTFFQPIIIKLKTKKDIRDTTPHAKFGWCGTTGRGSAKMANFGLLMVLSFLIHFASRPDHTV